MSNFGNGCEYDGIEAPFHIAHNNINSAFHWLETEKGAEPEMTRYSGDHATAGVIQPDANQKEVTMFVVVEHTITDPDAFFALAARVAEAPSGIKGLQFFPSVSRDRAICLWQANSIEAVKSFLEPLSAQSSRNIYYAVDSTKAMGLPNLAAAA